MDIIGGGLAGSEAALQLASRGIAVRLIEMRPHVKTPVHVGGNFAELVCSNSLKSTKPASAAGMLKYELSALGSFLIRAAHDTEVAAGGALAVDREKFSAEITRTIRDQANIACIEGETIGIDDGSIVYRDETGVECKLDPADAIIVATGPMTSDAFGGFLEKLTGSEHLSFYDAAAPIVLADSLDNDKLFRQSRYEDEGQGDYLNAPFTREEYEHFITELLSAKRVIAKDFETKELFRACQPIEEIARRGFDAPRHGTMKPVGLIDPTTGRRPWAALQLRAEDAHGASYNLVGFQTNLTFPEQARVFRMIPGFAHAEFARYGVMHRNTFVNAPALIDDHLRCKRSQTPIYFVGQVGGTEGYCEAIMSGLYGSLAVYAQVENVNMPVMPPETSFGSLLAYATDLRTQDYQPMHVNFGVFLPPEKPIKNKQDRYAHFLHREQESMAAYREALVDVGILADANGEEGLVDA